MTYWVYRYGTQPGKWCKVLLEPPPGRLGDETNDSDDLAEDRRSPSPDADLLPRSRYAYQVVYNHRTGALFIHGGNAGKVESLRPESGTPVERNNNSDEGSTRSDSPNTSDGEKENQPETTQRPSEEMRLNDFWKIKLHRCGILDQPI